MRNTGLDEAQAGIKNPRNGGAWWTPVYGVAQSWTRLRWLSSSSSLNDRGLRILSLQDKLLLSRNSKRFSEWGDPSWRNYEWSWSAGSVMCGAFISRDLPQPSPVILSMDITQAIFSNHNAMMLGMNYKKKLLGEPEIRLPTSVGSSEKWESSRKTFTSAFLTMPKLLTVWITKKLWKSLKEMGIPRAPDLPPGKSLCRSRSNS